MVVNLEWSSTNFGLARGRRKDSGSLARGEEERYEGWKNDMNDMDVRQHVATAYVDAC